MSILIVFDHYGDEFERIKEMTSVDSKWITHLKESNHLSMPGLKWQWANDIKPTRGSELISSKLSEALQSKSEFTQDEWDEFGIKGVNKETISMSYIKSGFSFYRPAPLIFPAVPRETLLNSLSKYMQASDPISFVCLFRKCYV